MGVYVKAGKFEATLPAFHTLPVNEVVPIMEADPTRQPYLMSQAILRRLTWLQRKKFESLSMEEFGIILHQWLGVRDEA